MATFTNAIRSTFAAMLAVAILATTLVTVGTRGEPVHLVDNTPPAASFTPQDRTIATAVPMGAKIEQPGELKFGNFAALRLDKYSSVTLATLDFNERTRAIENAKILVKTGRVWLANHVVGAPIALADDRVVVTSLGGAVLFDKTPTASADEPFTRIAAVTNPLMLDFITPGATTVFYRAVLPPGRSITLSAELVTALLNAGTRTARADTFTTHIEDASKLAGTFYTDNATLDAFAISRLLDDLDRTLATYETSMFDAVREALTFVPAAKARYWQNHAGAVLVAALSNPDNVDWEPIARAVLPYPDARAVFAALVPYTRLTASGALPPKTKTMLASLAKLDSALSRISGITPLTPDATAMREMLFASAFSDQLAIRDAYLARVATTLPDAPTERTEFLTAALAPLVAKVGTNEAAALIAALTAGDGGALANQIGHEFTTLTTLVAAGRRDAAETLSSKLTADLASATTLLPGESTAAFSDRLPELTRRIAYLGTLHGAAPKFDETAYQTWLATSGAPPTDTTAPTPITTSTAPTSAARPTFIFEDEPTTTDPSPTAASTSTEPSTPASTETPTQTPPARDALRPNTSLQKTFDLLKADALHATQK